jgi:hypothetical protein
MAVKQAGRFMRTGMRGSPSWPGRTLMGRIHCSRLLATNWHQSTCRPGAGHTFGSDRRALRPRSAPRRSAGSRGGSMSVSGLTPLGQTNARSPTPTLRFVQLRLGLSWKSCFGPARKRLNQKNRAHERQLQSPTGDASPAQTSVPKLTSFRRFSASSTTSHIVPVTPPDGSVQPSVGRAALRGQAQERSGAACAEQSR